ncbi:MAG: orotidine-5'-phosphate decarboxylase [Candidatus Thermoplasmatota archaeon]|jgi:orotidine-5'-phosphate decarboxylase|nr:orotidine-5'-phosphate decarboxylase [Candidatus Thermoplasmatota archaeon]MCL5794736.1 orotidine-5'-phosphate decarboxylase [Candidatus Thermoplasmatota archaeon]
MDKRLIVALDVFDGKLALEITSMLKEIIFAVKINWPLILGAGPGIIRDLSRYSRVICDLKVADIPNTNALITGKVAELGAYGIISHVFTGTDSLRAVRDAGRNLKLLAVVSMSHPGGSQYINRVHSDLLKSAISAGADGVIAPGNDETLLSQIRETGADLVIVSPGIGAQGGSAARAIMAGADYVIVGRSIYESSDPATAASGITRQIHEGIASRSTGMNTLS